MLEGGFGVFELFLPAQVAVFDDEAPGFGEVVLGGLPGYEIRESRRRVRRGPG
jgi:hypothetical protein